MIYSQGSHANYIIDTVNFKVSGAGEISTPDSDTKHYLGRAAVGDMSYGDYAGFAHRDMASAGNYALLQQADGTTFLNAASAKNVVLRQNNSDKAMVKGSDGHFYTDDGQVYALSDNRLKKKVRAFTAGLDALLALHPAIYVYRDEFRVAGVGPMTDGQFVGLAAQDVESLVPEAISADENGYLSLAPQVLLYALVNASHEIDRRLRRIEAQVVCS